jgi:hypothetical protein
MAGAAAKKRQATGEQAIGQKEANTTGVAQCDVPKEVAADVSLGVEESATSVGTGVAVVVVTPAKKMKASATQELEIGSPPKHGYFLWNRASNKFDSFSSHGDVLKCRDMMVRAIPGIADSLVIHVYKNEKEGLEELGIMQKELAATAPNNAVAALGSSSSGGADRKAAATVPAAVMTGNGAFPVLASVATDRVATFPSVPAATVPGSAAMPSAGIPAVPAINFAPAFMNFGMSNGGQGGAGSNNDIIDVDDDIVPFENSGIEPATAAASSSETGSQMSAFAVATIGAGTSMTVYRWRLPGARYHVYAYKLMDGAGQYWSHKPQMWMIAVQTEKTVNLFERPMTLHKAMNHCNAAGIRSVPCGDSTIATIKTKKSGMVIDQYLLYGLVAASRPNEYIADRIKAFVHVCRNVDVRKAYFETIQLKMNSRIVADDVTPTGKYWIKLMSGANNIVFHEKRFLSEIFLDPDIITMINLAYETVGQQPDSWPPHIRIAAFGSQT